MEGSLKMQGNQRILIIEDEKNLSCNFDLDCEPD